MKPKSTEPFAGLERAFHEPKRLAILSALAARGDSAVAFTELKEECSLTDGNLNRHLKVLEDAGAVTLKKREKREGRPRTEVQLTRSGRDQFLKYLDALESALETAARSAGRARKPAQPKPIGSPRRAPTG